MSVITTTVLIATEHSETLSAIIQGIDADQALGPCPPGSHDWHHDRLTLSGFPFAGDLPAADFDDLVYTFSWIDEAWGGVTGPEGPLWGEDRATCITCHSGYSQCFCWQSLGRDEH
jgi:hypothetical protein